MEEGESAKKLSSEVEQETDEKEDVQEEETDRKSYRQERHASKSFRSLADFYHRQQLCDVCLHVGDRRIRAHRLMLAAQSEYFRAMFTDGMAESQMDDIQLRDVDPECVAQLIDFVYEGTVLITLHNVQSLLTSAAFLQIEPVKRACADFLTSHLHWNNCFGIGEFAHLHACTELERSVELFCQQNFADVIRSEEFTSASLASLERILASDLLNVTGEEEVFQAILLWLRQQSLSEDDTRWEEYLPRLLATVRLPLLSFRYLVEHVEAHPRVRCSLRCRDLIDKAKNFHLTPPLDRSGSDWRLQRWRAAYTGVVYAAGGRGGSDLEPRSSVERYDFLTNTWESVADMQVRRRHVGLAVVGGRLYAAGGHDGESHLSSVERYNPDTNEWSYVASMNFARRGVGLAALSSAGPIYAVGGMNDSSCMRTVERFDPATNKWTEVAAMLAARGGLGVTTLNGLIYVAGGNQGSTSLSSVEVYSPVLDTWTAVRPMLNRRAGIGMSTWRGERTKGVHALNEEILRGLVDRLHVFDTV